MRPTSDQHGGRERPTLPVRVIDDCYYLTTNDADRYVRAVAGLPPLEPEPPGTPIELIKLSTLAKRLDCSVRTLKRRIWQSQEKLPDGLRRLELA
jgi:hypothetical protein